MTTRTIFGAGGTFSAGDIQFAVATTPVGYPPTVSPSYVPMTLAHPLYQNGNPVAYPSGTYKFYAWTKIMAGGEAQSFSFDLDPSASWEAYYYSLSPGGGVGWVNPPQYFPGTVLYNTVATSTQSASITAPAGSSVLTVGWGVPPSLSPTLTPGATTPIYATGGPNITTFWYESPSAGTYQRTIATPGSGAVFTEASLDLFVFAPPVPQAQMMI